MNRTVSGTGIQHAKAVLIDDYLILGSTNWTISSRANSELGVLIQLKPDAVNMVKDVFDDRYAMGERLEAVLARPRSRSVSASRYGGGAGSSGG